jgi:Helicase conserved C-terminal domain
MSGTREVRMPNLSEGSSMTSVDVRKQLIEALRLDLVGPDCGLGNSTEVLPQAPSRWYLTGFLVPTDADPVQTTDETSAEGLGEGSEGGVHDDEIMPEPAAARRAPLPSSIGLSLLIPADTTEMTVTARWGDYKRNKPEDSHGSGAEWQRTAREERITLSIPVRSKPPIEQPLASSAGPKGGNLTIAISVRPVTEIGPDHGLPSGTRAVSLFLVNRRKPAPDETRDEAFAFQAQLEVTTGACFIPRPDLRSLESDDLDECVADLQYREDRECAVGHNVATEADLKGGRCNAVRTCWMPRGEVERIAPAPIPGVELNMDVLSQLADGQEARAKLGALVEQYRKWIEEQRGKAPQSPQKRKNTADFLLSRAEIAAGRIDAGIGLLGDPRCLEAFRIANRVMAAAARRRQSIMLKTGPTTIQPKWRPFQLAFLLMNLHGMADPAHEDREVVDLLFFPTGGGKTEAYLGLAAFALVLRRLRHPGIGSAGITVLMRYTLRLLTLDQLARASTLICALELERQKDVVKLGEWPLEIGLWVGQAATPNRMGHKGDHDQETARAKTIAYKNNERKASPIPLEECPWCGTKFNSNSFELVPNRDHPTDLRINCVNRHCDFSRGQRLPIVAVDEPTYRRLPCFLIATVDKFAAMPWTGEVGGFFGRVERFDARGFYGPCEPGRGNPLVEGRLLPPDLIIQDELHLISGPLGTMTGLYETALDSLCTSTNGDKPIRPKIVASTATVRRAEQQIRTLFNHRLVDVFPPPGPDRRDSFFAVSHSPAVSHPRLYVGVAAQGRSPKVVMLRCYLALLAAAQKAYLAHGKNGGTANPADPYMTLVGYFNSLRELGGARRVIEDEVGSRLLGYVSRRRVGDRDSLFQNRKIAYEVVELTSRVGTDKVAEAKRRLSLAFSEKEHVDVAIATNMISVGLDIIRLGLMVVFGQPKTSAEYIQATSRVGRDHERPGLVVTLLNVHKPRDRSHYERFVYYHQTFYRSVEVTSATPFSPRALDRGLAGTLVALARQGDRPLTPPLGAQEILSEAPRLQYVIDSLSERAYACGPNDATEEEKEQIRDRVRQRAKDLLDVWSRIAMDYSEVSTALQYNPYEVGGAKALLHHFLDPELKNLPPRFQKFRANRSLRDVEPSVNLWLKTLDNIEVENPEEEP